MSLQPAKRYSHAIFDFDGVICDSYAEAVVAFNKICEEEFPVVPRVRTREDMTVVYSGSLRTCLHKWLSEQDARRFFDLHSQAMALRSEALYTFTGIGALLSGLGPQGFSIVTSAYSEAVRRILRRDSSFEPTSLYAIAGRELQMTKTAKIKQLLDHLGLQNHEAVYVGDLESDILYCRAVPLDIIAVGYGYHPAEYLKDKGATYLAASIEDVQMLCSTLVSNASKVRSA